MKHKLIALVAATALIVVATAAPAQARSVHRARMDITNVAQQFVLVGDGDEFITYVGSLDFGRNRVYKIAFFAPVGPPPSPEGWVQFQDRWEINRADSIDFYNEDGKLKNPFPEGEVVRAADDRGWANFAENKFVGYGPGGIWSGRFVAEDGTPTPFPAALQFVGPFWLFGGLRR